MQRPTNPKIDIYAYIDIYTLNVNSEIYPYIGPQDISLKISFILKKILGRHAHFYKNTFMGV